MKTETDEEKEKTSLSGSNAIRCKLCTISQCARFCTKFDGCCPLFFLSPNDNMLVIRYTYYIVYVERRGNVDEIKEKRNKDDIHCITINMRFMKWKLVQQTHSQALASYHIAYCARVASTERCIYNMYVLLYSLMNKFINERYERWWVMRKP